MDILCAGILVFFHLLLRTTVVFGGTFSIVHPKLFRIDAEENVVVNLHGYNNARVNVQAYLTDYPGKRNRFSDYNGNGNTGQPIMFAIKVPRTQFPNVETIQNKKVQLTVVINFLNGGYSQIKKQRIVYLTGESDYIFVQTERPIYKPGEKVHIRAVALNSQMQPMRSPVDRYEITVQTAEGVGIWKETRTFPPEDFIATEYSIPEDPPLGSYFAVVKLTSKTHTSTGSAEFVVDKYVLPTFNVEIELEQNTVAPNGIIKGSFKAEYSYGAPVVGTFGFSATLHVAGKEPTVIYQKPTNYKYRPKFLDRSDEGQGEFKIPIRTATTHADMTWQQLMEAKATITVSVSVMGIAEGTVESDTKEGILITNTPYFIDTSQSSKYFFPSNTYDANIIIRYVVTKEPVPGVGVRSSADGPRQVTDDSGSIQMVVDTPGSANQFQITIRTDDPSLGEESQAKVTLTLKKFSSNSGYLRMTAPSHGTIGQTIPVIFKTTSRAEIYHVVLSRGRIISWGKHNGGSPGERSQNIEITRKMSPSIRVVGYFMQGEQIVSDSVSIDIDDVCISEELTITAKPEEVKPGQPVQFTYQGQPGAMIGTSAVDRAAYFLNDKGRLDRKQLFDKMKSFDMGCSVTGGSDSLNVFEEAGLALTTKISATPLKSNLTCPIKAARRKRRSVTTVQSNARLLLKRKCNSNGRNENLADERCEVRKKRILKIEFDDPRDLQMCLEEFADGCWTGEFIRNSTEIRDISQRTGGVPGLDAESHPRIANTRRTDFREGWLWFTQKLRNDGTLMQNLPPPHSITTYDIDAISVHDREGFCVAKPAKVKVFKDFFIKLYLPYSVKVMEQVQIRAAIFNYHETRDRKVRLRVRGDETLCTQEVAGEWSDVTTLIVKKQSNFSHVFTIIPLSEGNKPIELEVEPVSQQDLGIGDYIRRQLKVEAPGSQEEFSGSFQLDPSLPRPNHQISLNFPDSDVLPNSKKCWIYGHMSYLGPIIEFDAIDETPSNLDKSLSLPHGCGEQNMKSVGPNVFAFNYLKHIGDPTPDQRSKVQTYIIDGYTRQQSHRNNKRWAIWSHAAPTIWINAYVDKVFLHALEVWPDMDIRPICDSLKWVVTQQRGDGSFQEQAHSRHYWVNVAEGGADALTAYVLITLAEMNVGCPEKDLNLKIMNTREKAASYLHWRVDALNQIPYTIAIVAYALALDNPSHPATESINRRLMGMKGQNGAEIYWKGPSRSMKHIPTWKRRQQAPIDIETTAYALLAQVTLAKDLDSRVPQDTVNTINMIARWMVSQQNDRGGFQSSQTTVIAVQSMTEYAKWIHGLDPPPRNPHLHTTLRAPGTPWAGGVQFNLDKRNEFYRKELVVPDEVVKGTRTIDVTVGDGKGRGSISYRCVYRSAKNSEVCDFKITAVTSMIGYRAADGESEAAPGSGKNVIKLVMDVSKLTPGDSGMAIIEIDLISGFRPIESSLDAITIKNAVDGVLDSYEVTQQKVTLYVEKIPDQNSPSLKFGFKLQQDVTVNSPSPAKIIVYDYYKPEESTCSKFYAVPGGSPMIHTSCTGNSLDARNKQQCKCLEGGCPACRTREEQLDKTCADKCRDCCYTCKNRDHVCFNLRDSVCTSDFGFVAKITRVDKESMPQFVKLTAIVESAIRSQSSDDLDRNQERTFVIRKDCLDRCQDTTLKSLEAGEGEYFHPGRTFLIRGRQPEKVIRSNGETSFEYFLDKTSVIERIPNPAKCKKFEKWRQRCAGVKTDQCKNMRQKLAICDNHSKMIDGVHRGCD